MKRFLLLLLTVSFISANAQIEKELPARPVPPKLVVDFTNTLAEDQKAALEQKLVAFDDSTSTQIAVVLVETTGDRDIADYAVALGRAWGIGNKEFNNGVLLLIAKNDRKIWIATGYGLEGALPDIIAKNIIENEIKPNFKGNDFYRGLDEGTDAIIKATKGEYDAPINYGRRKGNGKQGIPGIVVVIVVLIILSIFKRRGGGGGASGLLFFPMAGSSFGGGRSSGSGGGFGGFGGGSFGGGGAGGDW